MKITIIYDNNSLRDSVKADWGFSCLASCEAGNILFDTGAKEDILASNLSSLGIAPEDISTVFMSHNHFDHVGGLSFLLPHGPLQCFIPASSKYKLAPKITSKGSRAIYIKERAQIAPHIWSTGQMKGSITEQSLVIEEGKELVLITGCAHPGIVTIVEKVLHDFGKPPTLILGGFHFFKMSQKTVRQHVLHLKQMGIKQIAPCHCTGKEAINQIKELWGNGFLEAAAGASVTV